MIVSYNVLSKYVDLGNTNPFELAEILTNAGLEVERVTSFAQGSDLVIGYVKDAYPHPNSDHLSVCIVDVNSEILQIVCGAKNVGKDMYVIVAKNGCEMEHAKVPVIKKVELAGIESNGMIVSLRELGIEDKVQSEEQLQGIEVLEGKYELGAEALSTIGFDDYILDISLTPDRSDAYSIYALAIEVAGLLNTKLFEPKMKLSNNKKGKYNIKIESEDCFSYSLYSFNDLEAKESSYENKTNLMALGFKPRFNIVDAGNIAMVISGNPIHTFDADKLTSSEFVIKKGIEMEDFLALDNKKYTITKDDLLIVNGDEIVAIAGVIGSKSSAIDENTKNVVVEAAVFSHVSVRKTQRRLNLYSEASTRFSKIINPYTTEFPIVLLEELLNKECDSINTLNVMEYQSEGIEVSHKKIERILGIKIDLGVCIDILKRLSFKVENNKDSLIAYPHSYRQDVRIDVDLIEEIIRVYGYDNLVSSLPLQEIIYNQLNPLQILIRNSKQILVGLGLQEIITYQLNSQEKLDDFSVVKEYKELVNPMSDDRRYYRNQLMSSMVDTIKFNQTYQHLNTALFEIGHGYLDGVEQSFLSIGLSGIFENTAWLNHRKEADFYLLKGIIFNWLETLGFQYGRVVIKNVEKDHSFMHPNKSAYVEISGKRIGIFGEVHPKLIKKLKLKNTYLAHFNLSELSENVGRVNKYEKLNLLPIVSRDLSLVVPKSVNAADIIKVVKMQNGKLVKDVEIFDVYYGSELLENHYSLAITIKISDDKKTLDEASINEVMNNIISNLNKKLNVTLRT